MCQVGILYKSLFLCKKKQNKTKKITLQTPSTQIVIYSSITSSIQTPNGGQHQDNAFYVADPLAYVRCEGEIRMILNLCG